VVVVDGNEVVVVVDSGDVVGVESGTVSGTESNTAETTFAGESRANTECCPVLKSAWVPRPSTNAEIEVNVEMNEGMLGSLG
jgi:hypothetical protein